jgi:hypothetical protein
VGNRGVFVDVEYGIERCLLRACGALG